VAAFSVGVVAPAWYWQIVDPWAVERAAAATAATAAKIGEGEAVVVQEKEEVEVNPRRETITFNAPTWVPGFGGRDVTLPAKTAGILAAVGIAVMGSIPLLLMQYFR